MSDHEWRFLTKSSMALDGFACTHIQGDWKMWSDMLTGRLPF